MVVQLIDSCKLKSEFWRKLNNASDNCPYELEKVVIEQENKDEKI